MSQTKFILPVKGIRIPRIFLWGRGFIHGKIIHSGGLNPETGTISSGYITGQIKRFNSACIVRCESTAEKLKKEWADADQLLIELSKASPETESLTVLKMKRLSDLANIIRSELNQTQDQIEATAEMLLSTFACYGHGLLMKPVYDHNLPNISCEHVEKILKNHEVTWNAITSVLKEEKNECF